MVKTKWLLVIIVASLVTASVRAGELFVAAAASLTDVMKAIQPLYTRVHPDVKLTLVYGATGMLRTQVLQGAPCDVFIGADRWFGGNASNVDEVVKAESVCIVAANKLVVVAGRGVTPQGATLAAWLTGARKIGVGNPVSVPAGRYAKKLLEGEKLWELYTEKYVRGTNVREVLLWLRQGAVDVGFVYSSDLVATKDSGLTQLAEYATPGGEPIVLAGGIAKNTQNFDEAQAFLDYLTSPAAIKVLTEFGFNVK